MSVAMNRNMLDIMPLTSEEICEVNGGFALVLYSAYMSYVFAG